MRAKAHKMADAARGVDCSGMYHFRIKFNEQIIRKERFADGGTFSAYHFFRGDHRCQATYRLSFEVFLSTLKLPAFAVQ